MTTTRRTLLTSLLLLACAGTALAGNLDPPAAPTDPASALYTVNDLYNRLTTGAAGAKRTGPFAEPTASPAPTGHTTDELMAVAPTVDNANGATVADVVFGKSFWGLRSDGTWGLKVGAMPLQTLNPASTTVQAGYYAATNLAAVDPDLATANIKAGVSIYGVAGKLQVVDTTEAANPAAAGNMLSGKKAFVNGAVVVGTISAGVNVTGTNGARSIPLPDGLYTGGKTATAADTNLVAGNIKSGTTIFGVAGSYGGGGATVPIPVGKTGQTTVYQPGDNGTWQKGVAPPTPRFSDNLNGTVTDNATGLIWLQNADCFPAQSWSAAITSANNLAHGAACNLSDNSTAGQWRLPNVKELLSLTDFGRYNPALPSGHPFTGTNISSYYWSSTTGAGGPGGAWGVGFYDGYVGYGLKSGSLYVRCVRGGQ